MSIAVFGSINCDVVAYLAHLPKPGETLHGTGYKIGHDARYQHFSRLRLCHDARCRVNGDAADVAATRLDFSCV